jgi:protocatechuate 4,5-dioxygenase, beta chain
MAKLVCAIATTHHPYIFWAKAHFTKERLATAFDTVSRLLQKTRPDTVLFIGNDHLDNFFMDNMPSFAIGIANEARGPFVAEIEAGIPPLNCQVNASLAENIARAGLESNIDFAVARSFKLDHAYVVPYHLCLSERKLPIVPVFTNCFSAPLPRTRRFFAVGQALRKIIEKIPSDEKVAVLSSFNYSVDVGTLKWGCNNDFDQTAKEYVSEGKLQNILDDFTPEKLMSIGNSTTEFLNYVVLLGMLGDRKPDHYTEFQPPRDPNFPPLETKCPLVTWEL